MSKLKPDFCANWPFLNEHNHEKTSDPAFYNCVAHACGKKDAYWQPPGDDEGTYWPEQLSEYSNPHDPDAYIALFESMGYEGCSSEDLEDGFEKVAIFTCPKAGVFTHVSTQLTEGPFRGQWSSKLGRYEDIAHQDNMVLSGYNGKGYGQIGAILKRPIQPYLIS